MDNKMIVEIKNLSKSYTQVHQQTIVLEDVDFDISKGDFISIVGPSGSGKSTLLNLVGILDDCYSGSIKLFGHSLLSLSDNEKSIMRVKNIGFVFQFDSLLEEFTVIENIDMPARILGKPDIKYSMSLLEKFNLEDIAQKFPMEISGGEKQRAAILRALRNCPALVIADEPTGNLDKYNSKLVLDDLKSISLEGSSVLMVTHNEEAAKYGNKIYHLANGKLVRQQGTI
ncbi:MAG: ABC transporter ATP-binding protein [Elusimicrobia bacterium]|nr:ABC transporter ATP-binding protein [Elusimicrobiota bacterium]